jgi:light-regulated signal transduction histidine kinase (bacteriophytochrome)
VTLTSAYALILLSYFAGRNLQALDSLDRRIDNILAALAEFGDPLDGVRATSDRLMDSMSAQGFAMAVGDDVVIAGDGPDLAQMAVIDRWFMTAGPEGTVMSDHLEDIFPGETLMLAKVRGMAAVKALSDRSGWVRCYWFRPALPQEIAWAGNPNKPVIERSGVAALSPRRSFEKWIEVRSGYSRPWSNEEKLIAGKYRSGLLQWI